MNERELRLRSRIDTQSERIAKLERRLEVARRRRKELSNLVDWLKRSREFWKERARAAEWRTKQERKHDA